MNDIEHPSRRALMGVAAGAVMLGGSQAGLAQAAPIRLDPNNPSDRSLIFRRLAYASGTASGFWWFRGTRCGLVDAEITPFWEMLVGIIFHIKDAPGGYDVTTITTGFNTDLNTGMFIKTFANPFTGETIALRQFPAQAITHRYDVNGRVGAPGGIETGLAAVGTTGPAWIEADQVSVRGDYLLRNPDNGKGPRLRVNDMTTYIGPLSEVANLSLNMPSAYQTFTDLNTWPSWMKMGDRPGSFYLRAVGHKVKTYADMPALWREGMAKEYPDVARDPVGALGVV